MIHATAIVDLAELPEDGEVGPFAVLGAEPIGVSEPLRLGPGALVRSHAVLYRGTRIGARFHAAHGALIREHTEIGDDVSVGSHTIIEHHVRIADRSRLHSGCFIPEHSVLAEGCWVGPHVVVTNARHPNRPDTKEQLEGVTIGERAVIGAGTVLLPGVVVGADAVVGAGAVVLSDVAAGATVVGNPARVVG